MTMNTALCAHHTNQPDAPTEHPTWLDQIHALIDTGPRHPDTARRAMLLIDAWHTYHETADDEAGWLPLLIGEAVIDGAMECPRCARELFRALAHSHAGALGDQPIES